MTSSLRVLFATWDGGGNVPPTVAAIRALIESGHTVAALAEDVTAPELRAVGARVIPWRHAPNRADRRRESDLTREWEVPGPAQLAAVRDRLLLGPAELYAYDVLDALDSFDADVIVSNDLLFGAMVAAEASGRRLAVLSPNLSLFPIPGLPPFGPGFFPAQNDAERMRDQHVSAATRATLDAGLPRFNALRAQLGLAPLSTVMDLAAAAKLILIASPIAFDYPLPEIPAPFHYIGPFLESPSWAPPAIANEPAYDVLISYSTTFQGQSSALRQTLEAVKTLPVRAIATLGPVLDRAEFPEVPNVTLTAAGDHDFILQHARAVVTHAGHGTVMRALAYGKPLVVLPMGRDQNDNAARVVYHGAGIRLEQTADANEIRIALERVLRDKTFAANARRLGQTIRNGDAAREFVKQIEAFAVRVRKPSDTHDRTTRQTVLAQA